MFGQKFWLVTSTANILGHILQSTHVFDVQVLHNCITRLDDSSHTHGSRESWKQYQTCFQQKCQVSAQPLWVSFCDFPKTKKAQIKLTSLSVCRTSGSHRLKFLNLRPEKIQRLKDLRVLQLEAAFFFHFFYPQKYQFDRVQPLSTV